MTRHNLERADVDSLVAAYTEAAANQGGAIESGNHKEANRMADRLIAIFRELRDRDVTAKRRLLGLLTHPDPGVRCWSAAHALEFAPEEGQRTLEALAPIANSFIALMAATVLKQWRRGELKFP